MPLVARGITSGDTVNTVHGICKNPGIIQTDEMSGDVFVVNHGVHRKDDLNVPHTHCPPVYGTPVVTYSPDVFANGKNVARLHDTYSCSAKIVNITQSTVFANG